MQCLNNPVHAHKLHSRLAEEQEAAIHVLCLVPGGRARESRKDVLDSLHYAARQDF